MHGSKRQFTEQAYGSTTTNDESVFFGINQRCLTLTEPFHPQDFHLI